MITPNEIKLPEDTSGIRYALVRAWREMVTKANTHLIQWRYSGADAGGVGQVNKVNFTGAGVTAAVVDDTLTVTIGGGGAGGGNSVTVTCDFGASFTDRAQTVVTGQAWVTATSEIVVSLRTPSGVDPDEMYLLDFKPVISGLVAGTGFTLTVYSEPEAKGSYDFMCIGV